MSLRLGPKSCCVRKLNTQCRIPSRILQSGKYPPRRMETSKRSLKQQTKQLCPELAGLPRKDFDRRSSTWPPPPVPEVASFMGRGHRKSIFAGHLPFTCALENNKMYSHPDAHNAFGTDWVIYSPDVPVFRDDNGRLLDRAEHFSILTCAAVNANGVQKYLPHRSGDIGPVMLKRMSKLLRVAALQHHDSLVLGAWGCGAFGNDGQLIARLFRETFQSEVRGIFTRVVFSITDWSADLKFIGPFKTIFA